MHHNTWGGHNSTYTTLVELNLKEPVGISLLHEEATLGALDGHVCTSATLNPRVFLILLSSQKSLQDASLVGLWLLGLLENRVAFHPCSCCPAWCPLRFFLKLNLRTLVFVVVQHSHHAVPKELVDLRNHRIPPFKVQCGFWLSAAFRLFLSQGIHHLIGSVPPLW